ncbi:hypothetical protein OUZ56_021553 [Daphnia magna]|uniref:GMP synthase n=1 Tax=Daphnia magna TaxID=35525 RepID=A0ABR0ATV1_9CRUS|nr:hypothetical protein OUZ56_021553 [Daphnia magna]
MRKVYPADQFAVRKTRSTGTPINTALHEATLRVEWAEKDAMSMPASFRHDLIQWPTVDEDTGRCGRRTARKRESSSGLRHLVVAAMYVEHISETREMMDKDKSMANFLERIERARSELEGDMGSVFRLSHQSSQFVQADW